MKFEEHYIKWADENEREYHHDHAPDIIAYVKPASDNAVNTILERSEDDEDGRSNWMWVRLPNGDLILGVFPQGDTYCEFEREHS